MSTVDSLALISTTNPFVKPGSVFSAGNRIHLSVVLTLLLLLLYAHRAWYVNLPLSIIAIAALIFPVLSCSRVVWAVVTVIVTLGSLENWYALDNHKYLLGYWCLALFCFFSRVASPLDLAKTARCLIGLVFALAVLQKTAYGDYLDSSFFYYELLLDERFGWLARHFGGVPDHVVELNVAARNALLNFDSRLVTVRLEGRPNLDLIASVITWWNYLIQLAIAAAFLLPGPDSLRKYRDIFLLVFLVTTYLFAPVIGFGWVLATMGVAQTTDEQTGTRVAYVGAFLLLQSYRIPWSEVWALLSGFFAGPGG